MKYQLEVIVDVAHHDPMDVGNVIMKRKMVFMEFETIKFDAKDVERFLADIEADMLIQCQQENHNAFDTSARVVGLYENGNFVDDLDKFFFGTGIAYALEM